jgi:hypothetical protein
MLSCDRAATLLRDLAVLTRQIAVELDRWPGRRSKSYRDLETFQINNLQVFPLLENVVRSRNWPHDLQTQVRDFLIRECEAFDGGSSVLARKRACFWIEELTMPVWDHVLAEVHDKLTDIVRDTSFLFFDLCAFNALPTGAFGQYRGIVEPVVAAFRDRIEVVFLDNTDGLRAHTVEPEGLSHILEFATAVCRQVLSCRRDAALVNAINAAIGVSIGGCKFHVLKRSPVPEKSQSDAPVWYDAAKNQEKAARLCKAFMDKGGVIVVSDSVRERVQEGWCRREKLSSLVQQVKPEEDYEVNIYDPL